jgi:mannose-1-phosphate guanylyltransferase
MKGEEYALIMAGGGGTRLWPASRKRLPKQFLPLGPDRQTLLEATVDRLRPVIPSERILVVTAADQVNAVLEACPRISRDNVVVEPEARNTAACIGLGALEAQLRDPNAVLAVVPSDHFVSNVDIYREAVENALRLAREDKIALIGIPPSSPETGYGYVRHAPAQEGGAYSVEKFVEKPDKQKAQEYAASGQYLWNAGMFFFRARTILAALHQHLPELGKIMDELEKDPARTQELYPKAPAISIDYGVMEKLPAGQVRVVPGRFGWSDVGSWNQLGVLAPADSSGNVRLGEVLTLDSKGNVLYSGPGRLVAALGVQDLAVVATDEVVLVMPKERAQDVRNLVRELESRKLDRYL